MDRKRPTITRHGDTVLLSLQADARSRSVHRLTMQEARKLNDLLTQLIEMPLFALYTFENGTWKVFDQRTGEEVPELHAPNVTLEGAKADERVAFIDGQPKATRDIEV